VKHTLRFFTGVLSDYILLISASTQTLREDLSNVYNKQTIQVFFYNTGFIVTLWYENYHISLVATATHEIFTFVPLDENKCCIYSKNLNTLYLF
jgi:hypothetical protein